MGAAKRKARVVSARSLAKAIDEAVAGAAERQQLKPGAQTLLGPGRITGRALRQVDLNAAFEFATEVSARVSKLTGIGVTPALMRFRGGVLSGFFPAVREVKPLNE